MEFYRNKSSGALFVEHPVQEHLPPGIVRLIDVAGHTRQYEEHLFLVLDQTEGLEATPAQQQAYAAAEQEHLNTMIDSYIKNMSMQDYERLQHDPRPAAQALVQRFLMMGLNHMDEEIARHRRQT